MAVPTVRAVGTIIDGTGAVSPALPAGTVAGDLLIMFAECQASEDVSAAGWNLEIVSQNPSGGGSNTALHVLWKIAAGGDATLTNDPGDHIIARIIGITAGTFDATNPFEDVVSGNETATDTTGSITGATTGVIDCLVFTAITTGLDPGSDSTAAFSAWTNANLTNGVERIDNSRAIGLGGSLGVQSWTKASAGAIGTTTVTTPSSPKAFTCFAIQPPQSVAHTVTPTDTVALVDSPTLAMGFDLQLPDTVALADSLTLAIDIDLQATDTVALADSLTADLALALDLADPLALADLFDSQLDQLLDLVDTVALVDLLDAPLVLVTDLTDTVGLADLFDGVLATGLDLADAVGLIDALSTEVGANEIAFSDVAALADDLTWTATYDETLVDTVGLADSFALAAEIGLVPTDTVALADLFDSTFGRNVDFVDVMGLVDDLTLALDSALVLSDTLPLADSLTADQSSTAVTGEPVLTLKGKAFTLPEPAYAHFLGDPALILKGKAFTLVLSDIAVTGKAKLMLRGKAAVGTQPGLTITVPVSVNLVPTTASNVTLNGATCADVNLVPTVEEFR